MLFIGPAQAFDVDGLKSHMEKSEVERLLETLGYQVSPLDGGLLHGEASDGRTISVNFCRDRLVSVQKFLDPSFSRFVEAAALFNSTFGPPSLLQPRVPDPTSNVQTYALDFAWRTQAGAELVSVSYADFGSSAQLDVTYEVKNSCYSIP
jgi:hypothetical protein